MTPALRTAILDALMDRWRNSLRFISPDPFAYAAVFKARMALEEPTQRAYLSSCLDLILPVAEPMIREAAAAVDAPEIAAAEIRGLEMAKEIAVRRAEANGLLSFEAAVIADDIAVRIAELKAKTEP